MSVAKVNKISPLDPTAAEPFYRQIYDRFRRKLGPIGESGLAAMP